jgi:predicted aminopeptidase
MSGKQVALFGGIAAAVLALLGIGGFVLYRNRDKFRRLLETEETAGMGASEYQAWATSKKVEESDRGGGVDPKIMRQKRIDELMRAIKALRQKLAQIKAMPLPPAHKQAQEAALLKQIRGLEAELQRNRNWLKEGV